MSRARGRNAYVATWLGVASTLAVCAARADASDPGQAEQLFLDGKALMAAGNYAEACPLLQASYAAEPATGALLALARCYEQAEKLESARRAYAGAAERSATEQNPEREQVARGKAVELEAQRSTVVIEVGAANPAELSVHLDGVALEPNMLGTLFGLDGGEHVVELSAAGKLPVRVEFTLAARAEVRRILVALLRDAPAPSAPRAATATPPAARRKWSPETWIGVGTAAAGVVALAVGTGLAVHGGNGNPRSAEAAGLCFALGGVLAATGGLVVLATHRPGDAGAAQAPAVRANAWLSPSSVGVSAAGRF